MIGGRSDGIVRAAEGLMLNKRSKLSTDDNVHKGDQGQ
jgi:hypothetical protein